MVDVKRPNLGGIIVQHGYTPVEKGYQPQSNIGLGAPKPDAGHQPTTGQGAPSGPPPNRDTGGKPSK